jgi:tRNA (guanine-N7-)-methyltransferase
VSQSDDSRSIRSFVIRTGRMTPAQLRAMKELLPRYELDQAQQRDPLAAFARRAPLHLEIGIGNGDNVVQAAKMAPAINFLGCEVHRPGLGHVLQRLHDEELSNLRIVQADAIDLLRRLPPHSLDRIAMFFPDPWPKKRHHKRRLLQLPFLRHLARASKPNACFLFASDNEDYANSALEAIEAAPEWLNLAGLGRWAPRPDLRVVTRFEARALAAGSEVFEIAAAPKLTCHQPVSKI